MWFKHPAWVPVAWLLSAANIGATWFAAMPGEAWHATTHALLAVLLGVGAQRLATRQALQRAGGAGALGGIDLASLRQADSETLQRLEQSVEAIAIELERIGEGQRFITKALVEGDRESAS
jgi:hypothetical protein